MESFNDPSPENSSFLHALGARDSLELPNLGGRQFDAHGRTLGAHENGFADLLQLVREIREVVLIPEAGQRFDGIRFR